MKTGSSLSWRKEGDAAAFDDGAWGFRSRQFATSAKFLLHSYDERLKAKDYQAIVLLPTAEFLLALAIELICKAVLLKQKVVEPQAIYRHQVSELLPKDFLAEAQVRLLLHAERYVVWAGRYPTPKWTKEQSKEDFDVPSTFINGIEHIDGNDLPNSASRSRCDEMLALYEKVRAAWEA